jgi:putative PIN family toxin of toxin-antitoxin system
VRAVLDTNTLVSAVISPSGSPRRLLDAARAQVFELCTSATLLAELLDVLPRAKFATRLAKAGLTPQSIIADLRRLAYLATPLHVPAVIAQDPDDDHVLACALAASADFIVSGDKHLHNLGGTYQGIPILTPAQALLRVTRS